MVPASFDFWLANLNPGGELRGDFHPFGELEPDAVQGVRCQVQRVGHALIVLGAKRRELPAEQAGDADVADGMKGNEQHSSNHHQGVEDPRPLTIRTPVDSVACASSTPTGRAAAGEGF
jgi:hypothetical protein